MTKQEVVDEFFRIGNTTDVKDLVSGIDEYFLNDNDNDLALALASINTCRKERLAFSLGFRLGLIKAGSLTSQDDIAVV